MEWQFKDHYRVLELEPDATEKDITKAYRRLAKNWHPDTCDKPNALERYKEIVKAFEILGNKEEKEAYDQAVKLHKEGKLQTFKEVYGAYHTDIIGAHSPIPGENVEMVVDFTVSEVRQETTKEITFDRYINCQTCEGHGYIRKHSQLCELCSGRGFSLETINNSLGEIQTEKECGPCHGKGYLDTPLCESCKGKGKKDKSVTIQFPLPKETTDGFRLRLKAKGDEGINGGRQGDLIVILKQSKDDPYEIEHDYDLTLQVDVPFDIALVGGKIPVSVPRGKHVYVPIARGTQTGHRTILPDEGLFNPTSGYYGNLTTIAQVQVPTLLSDEQASKILRILEKRIEAYERYMDQKSGIDSLSVSQAYSH